MTLESKECIKSFIIPVLLGDTKEARLFSKKIFKKLGIVSLLCDQKQTVSSKMLLCVRFHKFCPTKNNELLKEQLFDLYRRNSQAILILVPFSEEFSCVTSQFKSEIENMFILSSSADFFNCEPVSNILS